MAKDGRKSPFLQFAGCVLVSVGLLNLLLSLKSGDRIDIFTIAVSTIGAACLLISLQRPKS